MNGKGRETQQGKAGRTRTGKAATARISSSLFLLLLLLLLLLPRSGASTVIFFTPLLHTHTHRHKHTHRNKSEGEKAMIYRGQQLKQQHSLTNAQWQPWPRADTMPHYKSREVAAEEEEEEGRGMDRERCRGRREVMGERWRRISKCFLKHKQPPASERERALSLAQQQPAINNG